MPDVTRLPASEDNWWEDKPTEDTAPPYDEDLAAEHAAVVGGSVNMLSHVTEQIDTLLLDGSRYMLDHEQTSDLVSIAVALADVRRRLAQIEALIARQVGRSDVDNEGTLPDGRAYTVRRGANRKAWDHAAWKHDVRQAILSGIGLDDVYDQNTGEHVDLMALLAAAQDVHGAGDPKVTALKALGLTADDYCEVTPGSWSVQVVKGE